MWMVNTLERVFTPDFIIHTITMHSSLIHGWYKARSAFGMDNRTANYPLPPPPPKIFPLLRVTDVKTIFFITLRNILFFFISFLRTSDIQQPSPSAFWNYVSICSRDAGECCINWIVIRRKDMAYHFKNNGARFMELRFSLRRPKVSVTCIVHRNGGYLSFRS